MTVTGRHLPSSRSGTFNYFTMSKEAVVWGCFLALLAWGKG